MAKPVLFLGNPASLLDEVPVHESGERDRTTEAEATEIEEIPDERAEAGARRGG